ncbi:hypothetical protein MJN51_36425, partial [Salmonella enterica subsp. enterica serovar Kentucky]|nr:hypothetical protein [Salmonella enterica subsp. enterica serovar Kentucky]
TKYGHPTPTQVNVKATEGKCILISGHDLKDLYNLLEQTEGTGLHRRAAASLARCQSGFYAAKSVYAAGIRPPRSSGMANAPLFA